MKRHSIGVNYTKRRRLINELVKGRSKENAKQRTEPMNIGSSKSRGGAAHHHNSLNRARMLLLSSALVITTFLLTRLFDRPCGASIATIRDLVGKTSDGVRFFGDGSLIWPERGFGRELLLRIYVYDEKEIDGLDLLMRGRDGKIVEKSCVKGQWGTQVKIHKMLMKSRYRTTKKEEADLFFVPTYTKCVRMMGGLNDKEINQTYVKVLSQMPYFRLSGGRDHVFVFPSGAGAHLFRSWAVYLNRSIILTPEGDRTDKRDTSAFSTWKDIIIPGNVNDVMTGKRGHIVEPLPLSKRKYLANYLGRAQGKVGRLKLIELAKSFPDKLECPELKLSGPDKLATKEYFQHLRNSKFCLAPRGESSWTLRFYESFFVECVPVILSDEVELPFQDVIDYTQISIKWPSTSIGIQLLDYLESIPDKNIEKMIARGRLVRCLFAYNSETEPCSAFHGILWELQRRVRKFLQSKETFWLHNHTIVNRNLIPFHSWKPPMPLP